MMKEEFGTTLFAAISACAGVQHLLRMIAVDIHRNRDTSALAAQYAALAAQAKHLVQQPEILDEDAARLFREYPWLGQ